uniref:Uncharacterized protein n=1 Tax=Glossina pallidipes TaxID=7398 RepID=A0A1B0AK83_GLOPL
MNKIYSKRNTRKDFNFQAAKSAWLARAMHTTREVEKADNKSAGKLSIVWNNKQLQQQQKIQNMKPFFLLLQKAEHAKHLNNDRQDRFYSLSDEMKLNSQNYYKETKRKVYGKIVFIIIKNLS